MQHKSETKKSRTQTEGEIRIEAAQAASHKAKMIAELAQRQVAEMSGRVETMAKVNAEALEELNKCRQELRACIKERSDDAETYGGRMGSMRRQIEAIEEKLEHDLDPSNLRAMIRGLLR